MERFEKLTPGEIYASLRLGEMQEAATGLDDGVLHAIAQTYGNPGAAASRPPNDGAVPCTSDAVGAGGAPDPAMAKPAIAGATLNWAFTFPDTAFWTGAGTPIAVANGRLYVGYLNRTMYALDARSGCAYWTFVADGPIRSGAAVDAGMVAFGDLWGNVYGLDERTGTLRWRHRVDAQSFSRLTGSVTAHAGRVYVPVSSLQEAQGIHPGISCCTANGSAAAFDIRTGRRLWHTHMIDVPLSYQGRTPRGAMRFGPSGAVIFTAPTVDARRGLLYLATGNQTTGPAVPESDAIVALDLATGAKRWVRSLAPEKFGGQDIYHAGCEAWVDPTRQGCPPENPGPGGRGDRDFAAPVMIVRRIDGSEVLVAGSKDGMLYALDPDRGGATLWQTRLGNGGEVGGIEYGMATDGVRVYAPISDADLAQATADGSLNAVDLMTGTVVWRTPVSVDACKGRADSGFCVNGIVSPPTVIGDAVVVGGMDGVLRAYDRSTGQVFWSFDAVRSFEGVNGIQGRGGGFGMGGVMVVGDRMFVTSGSGFFGFTGIDGNVLLSFQLDASRDH